MSLTRHVCRLPFRLKAPQDHVWISEDVLDDAMRRFAHSKTTRRHVSLAPGPLEARKRATKRRMVNLAQVGGGGAVDPALLQGLGGAAERRDWQWQSPKLPEAKDSRGTTGCHRSMACRRTDLGAEPAPLPEWLTDFDAHNSSQVSPKEDTWKKESNQFLHREPMRSDSTFLAQLKSCQSLEEIRDWATEHNVDLRKYGRLAFRQLVARARSLTTLLQALEDPALDTPGNRTHFLEHELRLPMTQRDAELLGLWMKRQLAVGAWSEMEIVNLANSMAQTTEFLDNEKVKCIVAGYIFEGLLSSTVLDLQDVKDQIPGALLEFVAQGPITRRSQALGIKILEALQPEQLRRIQNSISVFFQRSIRAQATREFDAQEIAQLEAIPRSLEVLRSLPDDVVHDTILKTSRALFELRADPSVSQLALVKLLDIWWSSIAKSSLAKSNIFDFTKYGTTARTRSQRILADQTLEFLAPYLRHFDDEGKAQHVLRHWFVPALPSPEWNRVMKRFYKLCQSRKNESPFLHVIQIAHDHDQLPDRKIQRLFRLLQMMQMSETIGDILVSSEKYHVPISEDVVLHSIRRHMETAPQIAEGIFNSYTPLRLERCPDFAETMILNPNMHPRISLEHYRSRKSRFVSEGPNEEHKAIKQARAHLLGRMALAYSKALHMRPRMAFRHVYRCYRCLISERLGSLPVEIVHAFVRAGIVRPLQRGEWVSTVRHRWILSLVRHIENPEYAEKVDELVYQWRGAIAKKNSRLALARPLLKESRMSFSFRTQWSRRWSRYERVVTPLIGPSPR